MGNAYVDWNFMGAFLTDVFVKYGASREDSQIVSDVILESDRRGIKSHGCNRIQSVYLDKIENGAVLPGAHAEVVKESSATVLMDAHHGLGMVAAHKMMELLIQKAKNTGVACGSIYNSNHFGIAGYWTTMAANAGMLGVCGTNARPSVAPTFGVEPLMGTNPLSFTFPSDEEFFYNFDGATSIIQNGKVEYYKRESKKVPDGLVIDAEGNSMNEPDSILKALRKGEASLLPIGGSGEDFGGYKGYGFAMTVEILSAALGGGPFLDDLKGIDDEGNPQMFNLGQFFIVIDPEFFAGLDVFKLRTGEISRRLRGSKTDAFSKRIFTPGEKEHESYLRTKETGVEIDESIQKEIIAIRDRLELSGYRFTFE